MMEAKDGISDNANKQNDELQRVRIHLQSEDGLLVGTLMREAVTASSSKLFESAQR
jgi:hypothetical protein